jgi:hypothetical protein
VIESYRDAVIASGDSLTNAAGGGTANPLATTSGSFDVATGLGTSTGTGSTSGMSLVTGTIAKPTGASNINSTTSLVTSILNLLLYMIGILAFVSLIIGGIQYLTASGDQAKSEKGKKTLIYSVIGIILTTLALTLTHLTICALSTGQLNVACPSGGSGSYNDWGITKLLNTSDSTSLSLDSFTSIVQTLRDWALDFAGLAAFIMILYASIIYLTSYGEESKTETAKKTLMWSVIGLAVAIFSKVLLAGILDYFR